MTAAGRVEPGPRPSVRVKLSGTEEPGKSGPAELDSPEQRPVVPPTLVLHIRQQLALSGKNDLVSMKGHEAENDAVESLLKHEVLILLFAPLLLWNSSNVSIIMWMDGGFYKCSDRDYLTCIVHTSTNIKRKIYFMYQLWSSFVTNIFYHNI